MDVDDELRQLHAHIRRVLDYRVHSPRIPWRLVVYCKDERTMNLVRNSLPYSLHQFVAEWRVDE